MKKLSLAIKKGIMGTGIFSGKTNQFDFCSYIIFLWILYYAIQSIGIYYFDSLFFYFVIGIVFFISALSIMSRRLNELKQKKYLLIGAFIPILNLILLIYLFFAPNKK